MVNISKQDVQSIIEQSKNKILDRTASRQEVLTIAETVRDRIMSYTQELFQAHQQQMLRQAATQTAQLQRQVSNLETRMITLDHEVKVMRQLLQRVVSAIEPQHLTMPSQPEQAAKQPSAQYLYRPSGS